MKNVAKRTKTKSLTIRLHGDSYDFIAKKSQEYGLSKSDYFISQLDENSEFMNFIRQETGLLELKLKQLKEQRKKEDAEWIEFWQSKPDEDIKLALTDLQNKKADKVTKVILSVAKKRGLL